MRHPVVLVLAVLALSGCGDDTGPAPEGPQAGAEGRPAPSVPPPTIRPISVDDVDTDEGWSAHAWDVTVPPMDGRLTFRLVDRDGGTTSWSSNVPVQKSQKLRVTLRHRSAGLKVELEWSLTGPQDSTTGRGEVTLPAGAGSSVSLDAVPWTNDPGAPLVIDHWHPLVLHGWAPTPGEPRASASEQTFTFRVDGTEVDLSTYEFPVLQAHLRFTEG